MRLFKYLAPERIDVLKNRCIRFSQAKYLNDPFEWLPFVKRFMTETATENFYRMHIEPQVKEISDRKLNIDDIPEEYRDKIPKETLDKVFELTVGQGLSLLPQFHPENLAKMLFSGTSEQFNLDISKTLKNSWNKYFGVLSLTQTNDNIPMWSHYAQNHEGFLIEFNPQNEFFTCSQNESSIGKTIGEVKYTNCRREVHLVKEGDSENDIIKRIADEVFFTKSIHWSGEQEIRVVDKLSNHDRKIEINDQEIFLFSFKPKAILAVYLGVNIAEKTKVDIGNLLDSELFQHVKLFQGELDLKEYKINFSEI
ncbi:MAG: DUF2971 domain-containing protein [Bacteroidota bacterium]